MELRAQQLTKKYRKGVRALDSFSYTFHEGIYGLLGPNGAGKSTLMGIITMGFPATSGRLLYDGTEIGKMGKEYRRHIGYMPQQQKLYEDFSLVRFLYYIASLKGMRRAEAAESIDAIIRDVNLWEVRGDAIGTYSGGMRQRALPKTVIIATHIVSDLEKLASEIIFLNRGKIVESGTLQELYENYHGEAEHSVEKIYMNLGMESR